MNTTIYDNLLPEKLAQAAAASFPEQTWEWWHKYEGGKRASVDPHRIPNACRRALEVLADSVALPTGCFFDYDWHAAGLHLMPVGSSLGPHTDAQRHPLKPWKRICSVVWFASTPAGGALRIGSREILPKFNRVVVFDGSQEHSVDLVEALPRKTLALFGWQITDSQEGSERSQFCRGEL